MKQTHKNNGSKCSEMECLEVEIFNHFSKVYTYIIWNGKHLLGEIVEDNMMKLLSKEQMIDFYHRDKYNFMVDVELIKSYVEKPRSND